jgi:hypothetical protein
MTVESKLGVGTNVTVPFPPECTIQVGELWLVTWFQLIIFTLRDHPSIVRFRGKADMIQAGWST